MHQKPEVCKKPVQILTCFFAILLLMQTCLVFFVKALQAFVILISGMSPAYVSGIVKNTKTKMLENIYILGVNSCHVFFIQW